MNKQNDKRSSETVSHRSNRPKTEQISAISSNGHGTGSEDIFFNGV